MKYLQSSLNVHAPRWSLRLWYVTTIPIPNLDSNKVLSQFLLNPALAPIGRSSNTYVAFRPKV
jgi:hypothetical protein